MAQPLTVADNSTITLSNNPPADLVASMEHLTIKTLKDLVTFGIVSSPANLTMMLDAGKKVTATALANPAVFAAGPRISAAAASTSRQPIPANLDLKRFGDFRAATSTLLHTSEPDSFWRVFREINPAKVATLKADTAIQSLVSRSYAALLKNLIRFNLADIVVQPGGTLVIAPAVKQVLAHDILIKHTGRIVVQGSGTKINANSIKGE